MNCMSWQALSAHLGRESPAAAAVRAGTFFAVCLTASLILLLSLGLAAHCSSASSGAGVILADTAFELFAPFRTDRRNTDGSRGVSSTALAVQPSPVDPPRSRPECSLVAAEDNR